MDVSFTNVLEGARQYFQGLPAPSSTVATSGPTDQNHAYAQSKAPTPTSSDARFIEQKAETIKDASDGYWSSTNPNDMRTIVEPYAPQPTRVEVPDTRPDDGGPECNGSPGVSLTEMQPPSRSQRHQVDQQAAVPTVNSAASPSPQLHQMEPPKSHSPPVYQQLNTVRSSSYRPSEMLNPSYSSERPPSTPTVVQRTTQYYPRYHHPDITKSSAAPFSQNSIYQPSQPAASTPVASQQPITRINPAESDSSTTVPHRRNSQSEQQPPGASVYSTPQTLYPNNIRGHPQPTSRPGLANSHNLAQPLHHPPDGSHSLTSNPCSPRNASHSHIPSPHNHPGHIPSPHLPVASVPPPPSLSSAHTMTHQQQPQQYHPSRVNASSYPGRLTNPYSTHSSMMNPQMLPPSSSHHHPSASPHEASHHASPSPQRQSPHIAMHNAHAISPHHTTTASPHHAPSPHNTANFQPHSPTYPPPPSPHNTTNFQPHSPTYPPPPSPRTTANFQPHSPTYPPPPPPPGRGPAHLYAHPAQHHRPAGNFQNSYAPHQQASYHSYQKSPQGGIFPQTSRPQYGPGPPQSVPSPAPAASNNDVNGLSYHTPTSKIGAYNGTDLKRSSVPPSNQNSTTSVTASASPSSSSSTAATYNSYRASGAQRNANTHNLPITAVSSYHSNRREAMGKAQSLPAATRQQRASSMSVNSTAAAQPPPPPTASVLPTRVPEYSVNSSISHSSAMTSYPAYSNHHHQQQQQHHHQSNFRNCATTLAPSIHQGHNSSSSTTVTSITTDSRPTAATVPARSSSNPGSRSTTSTSHPSQRAPSNYGYKEYPFTPSLPSSLPTSRVSSPLVPPQANGLPLRKRESPLDLSVKTVKTSADSTARDDLEGNATDKQVSSSVGNSRTSSMRGGMLPPTAQPVAAPYVTYDSRNGTRNSGASSLRPLTPQMPVCAPKVNFLPNFDSTPLRHQHSAHTDLNSRRNSVTSHQQTQQQQLYPPQHSNSMPLPHMSTFKKTSLPNNTPLYDNKAAPTLYPTISESPGTRPSLRYPTGIDLARVPVHEYPSETKTYYLDTRNKYPARDRPGAKRPGEPIYAGGPSKQPRSGKWPLAIDKEIHERLEAARAEHEKQKLLEMSLPRALPNGTIAMPPNFNQRPENSPSAPRHPASSSLSMFRDKRIYPDSKTRDSVLYNHPLEKPSAPLSAQTTASQPAYPSGYRQGQRSPYNSQSLDQPSNTGVDKRVLSLLRNSLENKQQREEQINSQQPILVNHSQQSFQNKVVAPVEPKTNIGRHNLSPFTAASLLERNSNTPPHYKFHVPRAVDSITQETPRSLYGSRVNSSATLPAGKEALLGPRELENQIHRDKDDSLAAILAAKIRTKAELKQVGTGQFTSKPVLLPSQDATAQLSDCERTASTSTPQSAASSAGSPPKLTREKTPSMSHRRRLFSRSEEENMPVAATVPAPAPIIPTAVGSRTSGFRSSSETSVFDFKESDSEGEMPVLERQTLEEMRRDRKQLSKVQPPVSLDDAMCIGLVGSSDDLVKIELKENDNIVDMDPFWTTTCDKFIEQLRGGEPMQKKRGRKRKLGDSSKIDDLDDESKESSSNNNTINTSASPRPSLAIKPDDIKQEIDDDTRLNTTKDSPSPCEPLEKSTELNNTETNILAEVKVKAEDEDEEVCNNSSNDSDELPLIKRATKKKGKKVESDCEEEIAPRKRQFRRGSRIKLESSSASESSNVEEDEDEDDDEEDDVDSDASTELPRGSSVAHRLRARTRSGAGGESEGMKLRSRDMGLIKMDKSPAKTPGKGANRNSMQKPKPKPLFGDGSDFRPGWEEEVYVFKKSLRMPPRLISVSKPSRFHRLSTSLPDLDPGSPALSVSMDSADVCLRKTRGVDSDVDSNYSFSAAGLGISGKIDDEEATSSTIISCPPKTTNLRQTRSDSGSIVDLLARKVGGSGKKEAKRKSKDKSEKVGSKVLSKGSNEPELLATPSLSQILSSSSSNDDQSSKQQKTGKTPTKNNKSLKSINVGNILGYFRKETVNNFRDKFKNNHAMPNEFATFVMKSRTRTETRVLKKQATIREVFGEDRPASAPPMQNHAGDTSQDDDSQTETNKESILGRTRTLKQKVVSRLRNVGILRSHKALVNSKRRLLSVQKRKVLLKSLAEKKLENLKKGTEESTTVVVAAQDAAAAVAEEEEEEDEEEEEEGEVETNEPDADNNDETEIPSKKKLKLRSGRRKFRSGFDYIRKKKKPLKKDESGVSKERKRQVTTPRPNPESIADIQTEIRAWVIKKGVGETMLHRAARLGYVDVTAYCLEKLNSAPGPKDNAGYTPLHEACSRGHLEIAKLLLAYGANVSESANGGIRPLHEAAENGATELVRLLLSYGADPLLATYAGQTPLTLAADTDAYFILEQHLNDVQGRSKIPWSFAGPSRIFDSEETGYDPLADPPPDTCPSELDEVEMEVSDINLPVTFSLANDPDKWVLLQDLTALSRTKSCDALLRQLTPRSTTGSPTVAHRHIKKELKLPDFIEQSRCCHLLNGGERINVRGSKVTLIRYDDRVREFLNVERVVISLR